MQAEVSAFIRSGAACGTRRRQRAPRRGGPPRPRRSAALRQAMPARRLSDQGDLPPTSQGQRPSTESACAITPLTHRQADPDCWPHWTRSHRCRQPAALVRDATPDDDHSAINVARRAGHTNIPAAQQLFGSPALHCRPPPHRSMITYTDDEVEPFVHGFAGALVVGVSAASVDPLYSRIAQT
jgi:hypothetical protein